MVTAVGYSQCKWERLIKSTRTPETISIGDPKELRIEMAGEILQHSGQMPDYCQWCGSSADGNWVTKKKENPSEMKEL
ncbi:hypothetical protein SKAU_G00415840 [Synaphobranchus kaupii]|uniref:Uncharacterized protein n=1 Tax=Synaphobranchus kaupii TaxID=118154 RepID=A0A9Q1E7E5_SYNKA|nr:hypothetical protein SKAU_G00415840 [Synaphobranchus kaupii]